MWMNTHLVVVEIRCIYNSNVVLSKGLSSPPEAVSDLVCHIQTGSA